MRNPFVSDSANPSWINEAIRNGLILQDFCGALPEAQSFDSSVQSKRTCAINLDDYVNCTNPPHYHSAATVWYVKNGWLDHYIYGKTYRQNADTAIIVPPNTPHYVDCRKTPFQESYHILINLPFFDALPTPVEHDIFSALFGDALYLNNNPVIDFCDDDAHCINKLLESACTIFDYSDSATQPALRAQMILLLTLMLKKYEKNTSERVLRYRTGIANALEYINTNCCEKLFIDDVCRVAMMSRSLFTNVFRRIMNISFVDYVNVQRMILSRDLLQNTSMNMIDIGRCCGFSDDRQFRTMFRRIIGISPIEFRISKNENTGAM